MKPVSGGKALCLGKKHEQTTMKNRGNFTEKCSKSATKQHGRYSNERAQYPCGSTRTPHLNINNISLCIQEMTPMLYSS
jgi:hypothetical protein